MFHWSDSFTSLVRFWQPQFDGLTDPDPPRFYDRSTPLRSSDVFLETSLGIEAPRGQKWKSWSWSWTFGLGLALEEKFLQVFKTFVVILDGSEQCTSWHFVRDNKSSLPFGSHCSRELSALHAHQPPLKGI